jgi:putative sporulation protein YtaF
LNRPLNAGKPAGGVDCQPAGSAKLAVLAVMLVAAGAAIMSAALVLIILAFEQVIRVTKGVDFPALHIQHFAYALLIALANNVDNLGARIAYSIQGTKVSTPINLWIAIITFVISSAAAFSGASVAGSFGTRFASLIAMALLVALGILMIIHGWMGNGHNGKPPREHPPSFWTILLKPEHADKDKSKHIDFMEGSVLGIALSINNIGGGLSAGMIGLSPFLVGLLSAIVSFLALWAGNFVADIFVSWRIAGKAAVAGGLLLIAIGIKQATG